MSVINIDRVVVLRVFIHAGVDVGRDGRAEVLAIIITRRTTKGSSTIRCAGGALRGVRRVGTAERTSVRDDRWRRDVGVFNLDGVVVLVLLVDASVGVHGDRHVEGLTLIIAGRAT